MAYLTGKTNSEDAEIQQQWGQCQHTIKLNNESGYLTIISIDKTCTMENDSINPHLGGQLC